MKRLQREYGVIRNWAMIRISAKFMTYIAFIADTSYVHCVIPGVKREEQFAFVSAYTCLKKVKKLMEFILLKVEEKKESNCFV